MRRKISLIKTLTVGSVGEIAGGLSMYLLFPVLRKRENVIVTHLPFRFVALGGLGVVVVVIALLCIALAWLLMLSPGVNPSLVRILHDIGGDLIQLSLFVLLIMIVFTGAWCIGALLCGSATLFVVHVLSASHQGMVTMLSGLKKRA